ncbi:relaxase [Bifidobacterium choerinum]|uniref:Relaxase n=2 Tax=Bifidobacterium choerinum TaxID=35760 RepID=A0A2D3D640_9BIFI|nr:relaxase [Bifidobacterium choerinum]
MVRMIPNITRGSNPAGLIRYLFGPGRKNEHRDQHLVCASGDMLDAFDLSGRPTATYERVGRLLDRRYQRLRRDGRTCPPDRSPGGKHNPEREDGKDRIWHCSLSIPAAHGALSDAQWEKIVVDYLTRMNIIDGPDDETASWIAVRHGLSANGNDHVHIAVQLARDDGWINPYKDWRHAQRACRHLEKTDANLEQITRRRPLDDVPYQYAQWRRWAEWKARYDWIEEHGAPWDDLDEDGRERMIRAWDAQPEPVRRRRINHIAASTMPRMHVARLVEACAIASDTEDEFIRRVRREGLQIDPFLRKGTGRDDFRSPGQVTGYRITWRSSNDWTERFNTKDLGDGFRLKTLRAHWRHDPHEDALAVLEWKAAMENRPPAIEDGAEKHPANLSVHDLQTMIDTAFRQAMRMRDADPDELRGIILDGIRAFDRMRDRYGAPPSIIDGAPIRLPGTDTAGRKI